MNNLNNLQDRSDFAAAKIQAIIEGMKNLNAVTTKNEISEFSGELDEGMTIKELLKTADKVAAIAGCTDLQKLTYCQDRLTQSAANFNKMIPQKNRQNYATWRQAVTDCFKVFRLRSNRKEQLERLKHKKKCK